MNKILAAVVLLGLLLGTAICGSAKASPVKPAFTVCAVDKAGVGFTSGWAAQTLSKDWDADVTVHCPNADVRVAARDLGESAPAGFIYRSGGQVTLNADVLRHEYTWQGRNLSGVDVFRITLAHETGHVFGLQHVGWTSVMYPVGVYLPTSVDQWVLSVILRDRV